MLDSTCVSQSQLDAYSQEKSMLMCETNAAQAELSQLGRKYAELLGHQNQKQKIRHVVKIKEENLGLKQVCVYTIITTGYCCEMKHMVKIFF